MAHHTQGSYNLQFIDIIVRISRIPGGAKDIDGLGEDVVVYHTSVDGEQTHEEDDVTTIKDSGKHLWPGTGISTVT